MQSEVGFSIHYSKAKEAFEELQDFKSFKRIITETCDQTFKPSAFSPLACSGHTSDIVDSRLFAQGKARSKTVKSTAR
jgi:hypothetical protein